MAWLRRKHPTRINWKVCRRYCRGEWWSIDAEVVLFNLAEVGTTRHRHRDAIVPSPWAASKARRAGPRREPVESRMW